MVSLASKLGLSRLITAEVASELAQGFKVNSEKFLARHNLDVIAFHLVLEQLVFHHPKKYSKYASGESEVNHDGFYRDFTSQLDEFFGLTSYPDKITVNRAIVIVLVTNYQKALHIRDRS
jgi:hypothetical protein